MLRAMGLDVAEEVGRLRLVMGLVLLTCLLFAVRLAGPPDLMHKAQHRTTAYTMDIVYNGQWIVQRDASGQVMSKPPLYNWLTAAVSLPFGYVNRLTMTLPAMVSMAALALLLASMACCSRRWACGTSRLPGRTRCSR
jgi:4-amino-4-deoxy-L-arabinose transferase-like glycosyltransferase